MKDKIADFFLIHGFKIMLAGFGFMAAGVIIYLKMLHKPGPLSKLGGTIVAIGVGIYIIGRVCVVLQNRRERKLRRQTAEENVKKESL